MYSRATEREQVLLLNQVLCQVSTPFVPSSSVPVVSSSSQVSGVSSEACSFPAPLRPRFLPHSHVTPCPNTSSSLPSKASWNSSSCLSSISASCSALILTSFSCLVAVLCAVCVCRCGSALSVRVRRACAFRYLSIGGVRCLDVALSVRDEKECFSRNSPGWEDSSFWCFSRVPRNRCFVLCHCNCNILSCLAVLRLPSLCTVSRN